MREWAKGVSKRRVYIGVEGRDSQSNEGDVADDGSAGMVSM